MTSALLLVVVGYLAGSLPTGVLLARRAGIDVRAEGSGNIGATNVARTAGKTLGLLTLSGDLSKGLLPIALARSLGAAPATVAAVAVAAILGHVFSVFLKFRGGKGVATGFGVLLGLAPSAAVASLVVFIAALSFTRIVSAASLSAAVAAPVFVYLTEYPGPLVIGATAISLLIVWRHQDNIVRLWNGTEERFRPRS